VTQASPAELEGRSYSSAVVDALERALGMGTVLLALLPIPVTALELLPTYYMHARFLIFYAPVACFLEVAYLFYVRDLLARVLFRHILDPEPEPDPYYRPGLGDTLGHLGGRVRVFGIALLPLALVALSFFCLTRYMTRFERSVELAEQVMFDRLPEATRRHFLLSSRPAADSSAVAPGQGQPDSSTALPGVPVPPEVLNRPALRQYVLSQAGIEDIPFFGELTALYIGAFLSAIAAALLMMLKEHAKQIMGISEEALMLGTSGLPE
jgi:hypothetical protein